MRRFFERLSPGRGIDNGRHALAAAATLFTLLAGHTVLEVARDALFLTHLPADQLPFTYLGIAAAAWVAAQVDRFLIERFDKRRISVLTLLVAAGGTVAFWVGFDEDTFLVAHAFYVWIGLVATFAVAQFWRLLADLFTVAEAKQLYARIAAGGSLGAVAGASIAHFAQGWLPPRGLVLVGAGLLALTAAIPGLCLPSSEPAAERPRREPDEATVKGSRGYVMRLLLLVALTSITAIVVDYVFKATIDRELSAAELGPFFSKFYLVLNVVSLVVQLAIAPRLLTALGATRALVVLPALLAMGAVGGLIAGAAAGAMLLPAIGLRGADGALRHSLHRSAFELLYLPLSREIRDRYKTIIDSIGQRGGQALGSVGILGAGLIGLGTEHLAMAIGALAIGWVVLSLTLRGRYLDLFRANLRAGTVETRVEVPQLDLGSLESLMQSLNSERDEEVLATLDVLVDYQRTRLIPALLLYHPSRAVVMRALELFADDERRDFTSVARRLLERDDDEVRAAAMRALSGVLTEEELRRELERDHPPAVRASVLVALVARGLDDDGAARAEIDECATSHEPHVHLALARAVRLQGDASLAVVLRELTEDAEPELRRELARGFGALRDVESLPTLIGWLGPRGARHETRDALLALGDVGLEALDAAFDDRSLPRQVRGHLPRTVSRFGSPRAAEILFERLDDEPDGWVRYKMLRGLLSLREQLPRLELDGQRLEQMVRKNLVRAAAMLARRVIVSRAQENDEAYRTRGGELFASALLEKEEQALDRAVRLIALAHPREDLRRITHALRHGSRRLKAESRELLGALTWLSLAPALDALLDDAPDEERLRRSRDALGLEDAPETYEALLREMLGDESQAVRSIVAYHIGELGLTDLVEPLRQASDEATGLSREVVARALEMLTPRGMRGVLA